MHVINKPNRNFSFDAYHNRSLSRKSKNIQSTSSTSSTSIVDTIVDLGKTPVYFVASSKLKSLGKWSMQTQVDPLLHSGSSSPTELGCNAQIPNFPAHPMLNGASHSLLMGLSFLRLLLRQMIRVP